jgi:lipopolysaccharide/colanic/teichoic acid biosynthesis glycosyltransferase
MALLHKFFRQDRRTAAMHNSMTATLQNGNAATPQNGNRAFLLVEEGVLPKDYFLNYLRLEKKRVNRSKEPLSIVLFSLNGGTEKDANKDHGEVREFLKYLNKITRETDIKGWLDENVIVVLLPDTGKVGVDSFVEKILRGNGHCLYSIITGTYPDHLFQELLSEDGKVKPNFFPLDIDEDHRTAQFQQFLKRSIDVVGALFGLILLLPIILIITLAIKVSSPGPIIFKQIRLGMKGVRFPFYKFRSMYANTNDQIHREYIANLIEGRLEKINQGDGKNPFFKMKSDSRVTRVGKILRKSSLDELPQFFNVLKGEMSLVGPRPPIPYELERYQPWHLRRILEMKPGITGLWQVNGRHDVTFEERIQYDLNYINGWNFWMDLRIILKTIPALVKMAGAQ